MDFAESHQVSRQCFADAEKDPSIPPTRYADLRHLVSLFLSEENTTDEVAPDRFIFVSRAPNLLIVDDELLITDFLTNQFETLDYPTEAIHVFASGEEAIVFARERPIGIALVDIKLINPVAVRGEYVSGLQVIEAIKEASPGAKVILISGFATYEMARKAILELGASYYLRKPFRLADALRIVQWCLEEMFGCDMRRIISKGPSGGTSERKSERILVVDDDRSLAEGIALALEALGYLAVVAEGGEEATRMLRTARYDAALVDLRMPGTDGISVLRQAKRLNDQMVVLILTGVEDEVIAGKTIELGAYEYLTKPCDINVLQLTLEHAFAARLAVGETRGARSIPEPTERRKG